MRIMEKNANVTPAETMTMYLHVASAEVSVFSVISNSAEDIVVASMPTHIRPILFISREKSIDVVKRARRRLKRFSPIQISCFLK